MSVIKNDEARVILYSVLRPYFEEKHPELKGMPTEYASLLAVAEITPKLVHDQLILGQVIPTLTAGFNDFNRLSELEQEKVFERAEQKLSKMTRPAEIVFSFPQMARMLKYSGDITAPHNPHEVFTSLKNNLLDTFWDYRPATPNVSISTEHVAFTMIIDSFVFKYASALTVCLNADNEDRYMVNAISCVRKFGTSFRSVKKFVDADPSLLSKMVLRDDKDFPDQTLY